MGSPEERIKWRNEFTKETFEKEYPSVYQTIHGDDAVVPKEFDGLAAAFPELADADLIDDDRALFGEDFLELSFTNEDQDFINSVQAIADRLAAADALAALLRLKLNQSSGLPSDVYEALKAYEATK